jgi:hypothetical protein
MDSAKLNDWMQVSGIFAVVISLMFVGYQLKQSQDIAIAGQNPDQKWEVRVRIIAPTMSAPTLNCGNVEKNAFRLNWRQAIVDVLLIVIGVSIALAADSWLGDRTEQARTDQLLDALEDEWTTELRRIDAHVDKLNQAKTGVARVIAAHYDSPEDLSNQEAVALFDDYGWTTFKPSNGAHSTLMADGVQNIDDKALRLAVASWRTVLDELSAEQAALRELGTLKRNLTLLRDHQIQNTKS